MIDLYTAPTPNGYKISIALEEMGLKYNCNCLSFEKGEHKQDWFVDFSPNARIPAIIDRDNSNFAIFESGAILLYLARKTNMLMPSDEFGRSLVEQWLMFQMGSIGPMMGQANVFYRYFPEKIQPVIDRYQKECRRLYEVLDKQLGKSEYLAGDYSIADIANACWVASYEWSGISIDGLQNLQRWLGTISNREPVKRGLMNPPRPNLNSGQTLSEDGKKMIADVQKMLVR